MPPPPSRGCPGLGPDTAHGGGDRGPQWAFPAAAPSSAKLTLPSTLSPPCAPRCLRPPIPHRHLGALTLEASSGSTGVALAAVGAALGQPVTVVLPDAVSRERMALIHTHGGPPRGGGVPHPSPGHQQQGGVEGGWDESMVEKSLGPLAPGYGAKIIPVPVDGSKVWACRIVGSSSLPTSFRTLDLFLCGYHSTFLYATAYLRSTSLRFRTPPPLDFSKPPKAMAGSRLPPHPRALQSRACRLPLRCPPPSAPEPAAVVPGLRGFVRPAAAGGPMAAPPVRERLQRVRPPRRHRPHPGPGPSLPTVEPEIRRQPSSKACPRFHFGEGGGQNHDCSIHSFCLRFARIPPLPHQRRHVL